MTSARLIKTSIAASLLLLAAACDRNPGGTPTTPPPTIPETAQKDSTEKTRPTTQELLTGPRQTIRLNVVPFSVLAPEQWAVKSYGSSDVITFLEGPAPHDDVKIQLSRRPPVTEERIELTVSGAKKEMAENPESIKLVDVRTNGNIKIFERQSAGHRTSVSAIDPTGKERPKSETSYRWIVTLFVPAGKAFEVYELNFTSMTEEEYIADKDFLRGIVDGLHYDAAAEDTSILDVTPKKQ